MADSSELTEPLVLDRAALFATIREFVNACVSSAIHCERNNDDQVAASEREADQALSRIMGMLMATDDPETSCMFVEAGLLPLPVRYIAALDAVGLMATIKEYGKQCEWVGRRLGAEDYTQQEILAEEAKATGWLESIRRMLGLPPE